jgi:hypothetical protein
MNYIQKNEEKNKKKINPTLNKFLPKFIIEKPSLVGVIPIGIIL